MQIVRLSWWNVGNGDEGGESTILDQSRVEQAKTRVGRKENEKGDGGPYIIVDLAGQSMWDVCILSRT